MVVITKKSTYSELGSVNIFQEDPLSFLHYLNVKDWLISRFVSLIEHVVSVQYLLLYVCIYIGT
jgi:hypothetical protein